MTDAPIILRADRITGRGQSLNPFVILANAAGFIDFASAVFGAREVEAARTLTPFGTLIHAELELGDSTLLLADPQHGWPVRPGLLQLWIADVDQVIAAGVERGATVITPPTPFYGSLTLARLEDPWGNLWWLYQPVPGQADPTPAWEGGSDVVFRTVDEFMREQGESRP